MRLAAKIAIVSAACVAAVAIAGTVMLTSLMREWGLSWSMITAVHHRLQADAPQVRNAEGPIPGRYAIAERGFVPIGGIQQWVTIRGDDRRNPAILILHGGMGDAYSQLAYLFHPWEKDFTVVQWDQRGAGRTYERYGTSTPDLTIDRLVEDAAEVADYARRRLGQRKIILLGHSWGSLLGVMLLKQHPEMFSAYVGTGQIDRVADIQARQYAYVVSQLRAEHDARALAKLRRSGRPPYHTSAQEAVMRAPLERFLDASDRSYLFTSIAVMLRDARYSLHDFQALMAGHLTFSLPRLYPAYAAIDLNRLGRDMPVPVFVIDGRRDHLAPPDLAAAYLRRIHAPAKHMWLIDGGHFAFMTNPTAFLSILRDYVRPFAMTANRPVAPSQSWPGHPPKATFRPTRPTDQIHPERRLAMSRMAAKAPVRAEGRLSGQALGAERLGRARLASR